MGTNRPLNTQPLSDLWKDRLDLSMRDTSELHEDPELVAQSAHANAIRIALEDIGASAVLCVQRLPTVVIFVLDEYQRKHVVDLHGALWNQGLASLLLVLSGHTIRAFSLVRIPHLDDHEFETRCLVQELDAVADGLAVKDLIYGAESGRLWESHTHLFRPNERIDRVLLDNLSESHDQLCEDDLSQEAAQALLIQTMFLAYLEDREIILKDDFLSTSRGSYHTFLELLQAGDSNALYQLFERLRKKFNGDLFVAPCSFDLSKPQPRVEYRHLQTLARFRSGNEEMFRGGQLLFWGYDFRFIPIELVSAVYDRFLGERESERRNRGAYYTPRFLADTVISSVWNVLPETVKSIGTVFDPACGSGIFLVRSFQLLCEHWRKKHKRRTIRWDSLCAILLRLHGWDICGGAVRIAVFSLYVALLQEVKTQDIRRLFERGRQLPELWDQNLRAQDFFLASDDALSVDVVIGNPPWSPRRRETKAERSSVIWCERHRVPMPAKDDAWAFVWKSLQHLHPRGTVAFVLPAMGFLHNHGRASVNARKRLVRDVQIHLIVNLSDMRFQLFEGASHPASLVIFSHANEDAPGYRFDYWTPKVDVNLKARRAITLYSVDKKTITSRQIQEDASIFKRRLWMSDPESKLFRYLSDFPRLRRLVSEYRAVYRRPELLDKGWVIGHGFKPAMLDRLDEADYQYETSETVADIPYLPIAAFRPLAQSCNHLRPYAHGVVHRRGFELGFQGPRVLIPRGVSTGMRRLRASYLQEPVTFQHIMLAISAPENDTSRAKLLTALLNSKLMFWFAFHGTASFGSDRPEIRQAELLRLPFPDRCDVEIDGQAQVAQQRLVSLIDGAITAMQDSPFFDSSVDGLLDELDTQCYRYFGLGEEEIALVEDAVEHVIPCAQPHAGASLDLWRPADRHDRQDYVSALTRSMSQWLDNDAAINVVLEARNDDLALLHLQLVRGSEKSQYRECYDRAIGEAFRRLMGRIGVSLPGNFQLVPDFRLFVDKSLYFVKPLRRRFWLKSTAIADADAIALELHDAVMLRDTDDPA